MNGNYEFNIIVGQEQFNSAVRSIVCDEMQNPTLPRKDPIDYELVVDRMDYSEVANCIYPRDLARHIDLMELVDHIDLDADTIADKIDIDSLADHIDTEDIADKIVDQHLDSLVEGLDYRKLAKALLDEIAARVDVPYDSFEDSHRASLLELWNLTFPNDPRPAEFSDGGLKHPKWKEMGWQGVDPATDFRSGGLLSLHNLIWLATHERGVSARCHSLSARCSHLVAVRRFGTRALRPGPRE